MLSPLNQVRGLPNFLNERVPDPARAQGQRTVELPIVLRDRRWADAKAVIASVRPSLDRADGLDAKAVERFPLSPRAGRSLVPAEPVVRDALLRVSDPALV